MKQQGAGDLWHYLDDFIVYGPPECRFSSQIMVDLCPYLGIPLVEEKFEGPTRIEIDTVAEGVRLPRPKHLQLRVLLDEWAGKRNVRAAISCWKIEACSYCSSSQVYVHSQTV